MLTINRIIKEMREVQVERLEELYQLVHSFTPKTKQNDLARQKILSFGGAFSDMSEKDYGEYLSHTKKVRSSFFDRNIEL